MRFEFATAARIIFGAGTLKEIGPLAAAYGSRALITSGLDAERTAPLLALLEAQGITCTVLPVEHEPTVDLARSGAELARQEGCAVVIGLGGGSAIDAGKAISALATNPGDPLDYLEVIGQGKKLAAAPLPCIAIPTTAGTGAEVTRNAVLASPEHAVKVSLRSVLMLPRVALVDPELTYSLPPQITASTGLDALTQVIEPFTSNAANPLTDAICREGITRAARSLRRAYTQGDNPAAREDMALASLFGGLALANAKLGAVHGFAGPLGGMFPMPHGLVCGRLLPFVMAANVRALQERAPDSAALRRYDEVAGMLTGRSDATAADGVAWIEETGAALALPGLGEFGLAAEHFPDVIAKSQRASSMKGNPLPLTDDELADILALAL